MRQIHNAIKRDTNTFGPIIESCMGCIISNVNLKLPFAFQTFPFVKMTTDPDEEPNHLSQLMMEGLRRGISDKIGGCLIFGIFQCQNGFLKVFVWYFH